MSKLVCCTSFAEGFPTVIAEGMVLGKPFVTTPVAGASEELCDNGKCGLVSDWNVEDYGNCIIKLLTDHDLYNDMSKNCLEKIKEFSIENTVEKFNRMIKNQLTTHPISSEKLKLDTTGKKRIYAIFIYAVYFPFSSCRRSFALFRDAYHKFTMRRTLRNSIKILYHLSKFAFNCILFLFMLLIGFTLGLRKGY